MNESHGLRGGIIKLCPRFDETYYCAGYCTFVHDLMKRTSDDVSYLSKSRGLRVRGGGAIVALSTIW
jgi:hypothetical protein